MGCCRTRGHRKMSNVPSWPHITSCRRIVVSSCQSGAPVDKRGCRQQNKTQRRTIGLPPTSTTPRRRRSQSETAAAESMRNRRSAAPRGPIRIPSQRQEILQVLRQADRGAQADATLPRRCGRRSGAEPPQESAADGEGARTVRGRMDGEIGRPGFWFWVFFFFWGSRRPSSGISRPETLR